MRRMAGVGIAVLLAAGWSPAAAVAATTARVVYSVPPSASRTQVARTAARMQARFRALGAPGTRVTVHGHRLVASGPNAVRRLADAAARRGVLELRPVRALLPSGASTPAGADVRVSAAGATPTAYQVGPPGLTNNVARATAMPNPVGDGWMVEVGFTRAGLTAFNRMARAQVDQVPPGNEVAIVVDGRVQSAPAFMTASFSGPVDITGCFSPAEARRLAATLQIGPYPVAVTRVR